MQVGILGPLRVRGDGGEVPIGAAKPRSVFVMLLLRRGRLVPTETLVDELWSGEPPATAVKALQVYVSQLRKTLGDGAIETQPGGYVLRADRVEVDADRFEHLVARGRSELRAGGAASAESTLSEALGLWRGSALADVRYETFVQDEIGRLEELRLVAVEARADAMLALGRHTDVVPELEALAREHPTREGLQRSLILALYRSGRQADALAAYRAVRQRLVDELGIEPSAPLEELATAMLRHDPTLDAPTQPVDAPPSTAATGIASKPSSAPGRSKWLQPRTIVPVLCAVLVAAGVPLFILRGDGRSRAATIAVDSVGLIDTRTGRVTAEVPVQQAPGAVAVGAGATWVVNSAAGSVSHVDPQTRSVVQTIPVGRDPSGIAVGGGGVWVANHGDNTVAWINPQADRVVRRIRVGAGPTAVAYGFGSVWVTNSDDRTLTRIDARSGRVTRTIRVNAVGRGVTTGGGAVWVSDEATRSVIAVDPGTNAVRSTATVGSGPTGIVFGGGSVWVTNTLDDTVSRVDATTLSVLATIPVGGGPSSVAFTRGTVWVGAEFSGSVIRIDPQGATVVGTTHVGNRPEGIASGGGGLWVAVQSAGAGHRGGRLVVAGGRVDSIDPAFAGLDPVLSAVYDGLTAQRRAGGSAGTQIVPDLAAALPLPTDGGLRYTFRLRTGIHYSDGRLVRPVDFVRALHRVLRLDNYFAAYFTHIRGAPRCLGQLSCDLSQGVTVGPSSLSFRLSHADPRFFWELALLIPVPSGTPGHDVGTRALPGTGPYAIESYVPNRLIRLERNRWFRVWSDAARPDGYPDEIVYRVVPGEDAGVREILRGRADLLEATHASPAVADFVRHHPLQSYDEPQQGTVFVFLNVRRPPFDDVRTRRALSYAVDRRRAVALAGSAFATKTCQVVPPTVSGFHRYCPFTLGANAAGTWNAPDLAHARALVDASGTRGTRVVVWGFGTFRANAAYIVSVLDALGYRARLRTIASAADYFTRLPTSAQAGMYGWFGTPLAVDLFESVGCSFEPNPAHFCDRRLDERVRRLERVESADPARAAPLAAAIDRSITDAAPWVPLFNPSFESLTSARVGNYESQGGFVLLDQLWVR